MYLRHQTYTLYHRDVCILVFLHVLAYFMLLRCMLKFKRLACGSDDVTQYSTICECRVEYEQWSIESVRLDWLAHPPVCKIESC